MVFNSVDFLIFFPIIFIVYLVVPKKLRYLWLLVASYYFYMSWNAEYVGLILFSTILTYGSGILIEKVRNTKRWESSQGKKYLLIAAVILNVSLLLFFKYTGFMLENINYFLKLINHSPIESKLDLILPVGISFYTFQTIGYMIDVYKGNINAEKNIFKYALFASFFPQLVAGPIGRAKKLLPQIDALWEVNLWNTERIKNGLLLVVYGLFQKLVMADRLAILVNNVYNSYNNYGFVELSLATILFGIQIYCDFDGYSNIARGVAEMIGIELTNNFNQPYLAKNIKEFWRRWHISLTSWFTDYIYISLGGSRKGELKKYANIIIVFLISGFWHGSSWNFVIWGLLHGIYQVVGNIMDKSRQSKRNVENSRKIDVNHIIKIVVTFAMVDFAWIFFRANSASASFGIIKQMSSHLHLVSLSGLGFYTYDWILIAIGTLILLVVDVLHENSIQIRSLIYRKKIWIRWIIYISALWFIILFGIYGQQYSTSQFIYTQF